MASCRQKSLLFTGIVCLIQAFAAALPSGRLYQLKHQSVQLTHEQRLTCDRCLPGWGLVSICNSTHTSICKPCPPGTWSPHHPHLQGCRACSKCGKGLYIDQPCTSTHDTRCGWCSGSKGHFNIDFIKKCLMRNDVPRNQESAALRLFFEEEKKQQMKASRKTYDTNVHHRLWYSESTDTRDQGTIILKPSFHAYHIERMVQAHRRKVFILVGLTGVILISTVIFAACFLYQYCSRSSQKPVYRTSNQKLYIQLTDEQQSRIRRSAERLEASGKEPLEDFGGESLDSEQQDEYWEENSLSITENPLDKLLPDVDTFWSAENCKEKIHKKRDAVN